MGARVTQSLQIHHEAVHVPTSSDRSSSWKSKECSGDMRPRKAFQRARRLEKASIGERGYSLWGRRKEMQRSRGKGLHETAEPLRVRKLPAFEPCERCISAPLLSVALAIVASRAAVVRRVLPAVCSGG